MNKLQKMGRAAALYQAAAYLLGIIFFLFIIDYAGIVDPARKVKLIVDNQTGMYFIHLFMYVFFGFSLVILVLALNERLKTAAPVLMQITTAIGLIWAGMVIASGMVFLAEIGLVADLNANDPTQAASFLLIIDTLSNALGGGTGEILGGLWTLLTSWAALRSGMFPRALNYLGLAIGGVGILSILPPLNDLTGLFGISQVVWFVWLGLILLRKNQDAAK
jgi:hypothetical protein